MRFHSAYHCVLFTVRISMLFTSWLSKLIGNIFRVMTLKQPWYLYYVHINTIANQVFPWILLKWISNSDLGTLCALLNTNFIAISITKRQEIMWNLTLESVLPEELSWESGTSSLCPGGSVSSFPVNLQAAFSSSVCNECKIWSQRSFFES